jgi:hypothetical protein
MQWHCCGRRTLSAVPVIVLGVTDAVVRVPADVFSGAVSRQNVARKPSISTLKAQASQRQAGDAAAIDREISTRANKRTGTMAESARAHLLRRQNRVLTFILCLLVSLMPCRMHVAHNTCIALHQPTIWRQWLTVPLYPQLTIHRVHAARGLPFVHSSLDQALQQHQEQLLQQQAPPPSCTPAQGASHNGVALPNLHVEAEFR